MPPSTWSIVLIALLLAFISIEQPVDLWAAHARQRRGVTCSRESSLRLIVITVIRRLTERWPQNIAYGEHDHSRARGTAPLGTRSGSRRRVLSARPPPARTAS